MSRKENIRVVAYFRTSSMANTGDDKDSVARQRAAFTSYARLAGCDLVAEFSDDGVKGADPVDTRPGFAEMLKHVASSGVRVIVVETASRFARDLITQETGWRLFQNAGISLIAADSPDAFLDDTPTAVSDPADTRQRVAVRKSDARRKAQGRTRAEKSRYGQEGRGQEEPRRARSEGGRACEEAVEISVQWSEAVAARGRGRA